MKFVTHSELEAELMRRPYFQKEHKDLDLEFALINALIRERISGNITQAEIARRMGTKQSAIARFESGRSNPTLDFIQRLATALGLKLSITVQ